MKISLAELENFCEIVVAKSIRGAARASGRAPSQISRLLRSLETKMETRLLERSQAGLSLSVKGSQFFERSQRLVTDWKSLASSAELSAQRSHYTIASTAFMNTHLLADVLCQDLQSNRIRWSLVDTSPDELPNHGMRGLFEATVHVGKLDWPRTWISQSVGPLVWSFYARANNPVLNRPTRDSVMKCEFVMPIYLSREGLRPGSDHYPFPASLRRTGFETATADAAVAIVAKSDLLAYLPQIVGDDFERSGLVKSFRVPQMSQVHKPLYLSVKSDLVKAKHFSTLKQRLSEVLATKQRNR